MLEKKELAVRKASKRKEEVKMENQFKDLTVEELIRGYTIEEDGNAFRCIFCGETYEKGVIYTSGSRSVDAERACAEHIYKEHQGPFNSLVSLEKQVSGLTDIQKKMMVSIHDGMENREISEEMDINSATVRNHKFKLQKMKREARIFLALMEYLENEELKAFEERILGEVTENQEEMAVPNKDFGGNTLHPFFTNFNLK